ncbi:hypothetical protein ACJX0J_008487, partial [Zea mays]
RIFFIIACDTQYLHDETTCMLSLFYNNGLIWIIYIFKLPDVVFMMVEMSNYLQSKKSYYLFILGEIIYYLIIYKLPHVVFMMVEMSNIYKVKKNLSTILLATSLSDFVRISNIIYSVPLTASRGKRV